VARYEGGWTAVPANTFSLPQPNYVSVIPPISIGGLTSWTWIAFSTSNYITLGDGTFFIQNMYLEDGVVTYWTVTELRQGVGVTYPSGIINSAGPYNGDNWDQYLGSGFAHSGYAIKLSGITSGGLGAGGAFGGGIQPL
jgi:hypothetical protein